MQTHHSHWDIFCTVVDNYGDIGVTWRLARQLADEYGLVINLWVDDLASFAHILPQLDSRKTQQSFYGVNIFHWTQPLQHPWQPGQVVIEAFACELPQEVQQQLPLLPSPPMWINLEYLSAEPWIDDCHGLQSPALAGVKKLFYFPGFTAKSGGLICEQDLFEQREHWQQNPQSRLSLCQSFGISDIAPDESVISLFCYENNALPALLALWRDAPQKLHLLVPQGKGLNAVKQWLEPQPFDTSTANYIIGNLHIHELPMTDQQGYDRLLWSCDMNIVRGEDSFLRAQWAAKPFIWHIYPQEEDAHLIKLDAFMRRYCHNLAPAVADAWQQLNLAFNQQDGPAVCHYWQKLGLVNGALLQHAKQWPIDAINDADLANRLVKMAKNG
ncbi:elongation factor P maturation arginine rhamnosyltransferase EarP [Shewanella dokdonensis]|uniref:Protein-arginine rhamnosyltransferase n=1 Tax=Shewanella dokdonensis TaxID=712036 RepID=A0ABX8DEB7_9GAMM|nr:elongation factor P maturation arginine rhamnosyltransferase EarP [Shewanella dokdonensis]MCL1073048.1 elongation factor P maturation arginine rhamnosyltransferase EarP [Shewanella dokdonensis]QVK23051.1 elongation factor P maturation arginine rhamnosyltransferase EarP [Shewanella dokdonensis]